MRRALRVGLGAISSGLKAISRKPNPSSHGHEGTRHTFLPHRQRLALYCANAFAGSEKARKQLNYCPQIDFQRGMALTRPYLEQAYGRVQSIS
jgi:hypothetical protein